MLLSIRSTATADKAESRLHAVAAWLLLVTAAFTLLCTAVHSAGASQPDSSIQTVTVGSLQTMYQTVYGSGAALTGASTYLLAERMNPLQRTALLHRLYGPEASGGVQFNAMRVVMGTCDFNVLNYTYDDLPTGVVDDFNMTYFTVAQDTAYVIPMIQEALAINPAIKIIASPWSAPAWMKVPATLEGGVLSNRSDVRRAYALYFKRYVETYWTEFNIPIFAVTVQNEPRFQTPIYPSMQLTPADEIEMSLLIAEAFEGSSIIRNRTKVLVYDHNWDDPQYPIDVLSDSRVNRSETIIGSAFHCYAGDVSAQLSVHDAVPNKRIFFTECCGGAWAPNFTSNLIWDTQNLVIGTVNGWAETVTKWNMLLDDQCGPHLPRACDNCWGVATVAGNGSVSFHEDFYPLAHLSLFLNTSGDNRRLNVSLPDTALALAVNASQRYPTVVLLYLNPDASGVTVNVTLPMPSATVTATNAAAASCSLSLFVPPASLATLRWVTSPQQRHSAAWVLTTGDGQQLLAPQPALQVTCPAE